MENFNEGGRDTLSIPIPFAVSPRSPVYKTRGINQARVVEDVGRRTQDSWEFLVGCVARFSCKILFQTWHLSKYVIITQIRTATKTISQIPFRIRIFLFFSYSFGIKTINTFIHYRNSLENHTRFQTKMGKVYTRFQTKMAQTPYPLALGRHILICLI